MTPKEVIALAKAKDVVFVELRHCTLAGAWQRVILPVSELTETLFEKGLAAEAGDAFSQAGRLWPDPSTAGVDPFAHPSTLGLICDRRPARDDSEGLFCARAAARRALDYLRESGAADHVNIGLETAFHLFPAENGASDSDFNGVKGSCEGIDISRQIIQLLMEPGLRIHAVRDASSATRQVIGVHQDDLLRAADGFCHLKHIVRQVASRCGRRATFMPLPRHGEPGCGLEVSLSLVKDKKNLFFGKGSDGLSPEGKRFIQGLLRHAPALCALTAPTSNSYRRFGAGNDAPALITDKDAGAVCGIPAWHRPQDARVSFRGADASANPYLAFAAILMAGLDGMLATDDGGQGQNGCGQGKAARLPGSLRAALESLEGDHDFLLKGGVFTPAFIRLHGERKSAEQEEVRRRPHPHEFSLYFGV